MRIKPVVSGIPYRTEPFIGIMFAKFVTVKNRENITTTKTWRLKKY